MFTASTTPHDSKAKQGEIRTEKGKEYKENKKNYFKDINGIQSLTWSPGPSTTVLHYNPKSTACKRTGSLHLLSDTIQRHFFHQELKTLDPQSINISYHKCSQFLHKTVKISSGFPSTFNTLPSDAWLALEPNSELFEALFLCSKTAEYMYLMNVLKFKAVPMPALNSRLTWEPQNKVKRGTNIETHFRLFSNRILRYVRSTDLLRDAASLTILNVSTSQLNTSQHSTILYYITVHYILKYATK